MPTNQRTANARMTRSRAFICATGAVQGVGFRPFVYRLARELHLDGTVLNDGSGVRIEIEGETGHVEEFRRRLLTDLPPRAALYSLECTYLQACGLGPFQILSSTSNGTPNAVVLPDIALCNDCRKELFDPADRRYRYPFINCTNCGPRFSIILSLPYDRPRTTMRSFRMCPECRREYDDPSDRRFHAQPNACPACGPTITLWNDRGDVLAKQYGALEVAVHSLRAGRIVALKGIGGFQLLVDASNDEAVQRLRKRKHREEKPMAVMMPDLATVRSLCMTTLGEERTLTSSESPILVLDRRVCDGIASSVAPGNPSLGVMLPYSPLHALIMESLGSPVVATSGNLSDEPMCIDEKEALVRLGGIADLFLVHDRPIARHVDDSVVRWMAGRELVIRRARGFAPLPVVLPSKVTAPLLCLGAHQKNAVARVIGDRAMLSQHIGDLDSLEARLAFRRVADDLMNIYPTTEDTVVVCDLHPEYASSIEARKRSPDPVVVQHHHAHAAACRAENRLEGPLLAVTWDGTGLGTDGTIWGGEFLHDTGNSADRYATLLSFPLFGGDKVAREPWRSSLGLLWECFGEDAFEMSDLAPLQSLANAEKKLARAALRSGVHTITTTSMGRLFDGVAALLGVRQIASFEGQAAMELEYLATGTAPIKTYPFEDLEGGRNVPDRIDWRPMVREICRAATVGEDRRTIAATFHATLTDMIVVVAKMSGLDRVMLTGGCFQNRLLLESSEHRLREEGFSVYWHQRIPPNDGGIALGQAVIASGMFATKFKKVKKEVAPCV